MCVELGQFLYVYAISSTMLALFYQCIQYRQLYYSVLCTLFSIWPAYTFADQWSLPTLYTACAQINCAFLYLYHVNSIHFIRKGPRMWTRGLHR
jgi:hypothetical protein